MRSPHSYHTRPSTVGKKSKKKSSTPTKSPRNKAPTESHEIIFKNNYSVKLQKTKIILA